MLRIQFVITGLGIGGAEMMLYKLLQGLDRSRFQAGVITFRDGALAEKIRALGVSVDCVEISRASRFLVEAPRLYRILRAAKPGLVHTWMYHADLLGGLMARLATAAPVVWCVRASDLDQGNIKTGTRLVARANGLLSSRLPRRIVYCSERARQIHERMLYSPRLGVVIPNGFDLHAFCPDRGLRQEFRAETGLSEDDPLIGLVARFDPMKDHLTFIRAAAIVKSRIPTARFVMAGANVDAGNTELLDWVRAHGLEDSVHLLGLRTDLAAVYNGLDVATLTSFSSEGFPNVVGEAMACGVPCVVTDVGDCAHIVGDTGRIVPPRDPAALASAIVELLRMEPGERHALGLSARGRVEKLFNIPDIVSRYEALYEDVVMEGQK